MSNGILTPERFEQLAADCNDDIFADALLAAAELVFAELIADPARALAAA